uniref:Putative capsid protein n=1 Tax=viral metagenome TaxID=1070528 RepID=A0A6M3MDZ0_9ZZZZ
MSFSSGQGSLVVDKPLTINGLFTYDDVDTRMLYKEFQEGVQVYNEVELGLLMQFVRKTTKESVRIWQRNMEFTTASEGYLEGWEKLRAMEMAVPLEDFELGYAFTKKAIQRSTAGELKETQAEAMKADMRLQARRFFWAAMTPGGAATSKGWWDANMATSSIRGPPNWKGNTFNTSHNHFDVSGSTDITLADFSALKKEIREHGYAGPLYTFMHSDQVEQCEDLAGWTTAMTPNSIVETVATKGFDVVKQFQGHTLIQDDWVPSGYLLTIEGRIKPLTMREPLQASARGLKLWEGPYEAYPLAEAYYSRCFDLAVVHRGAGAIRYLEETWATPTFDF